MIFAGMSGSAVADAGGIGTIEIKAMQDAGYDTETAAAITAASATIGPIIPPSLPMIIYGVSAEASIGDLFLGGVIPGLLMGVALMLMVGFVARREGMGRIAFPGFRVLGKTFVDCFFAIMTPVVILGGMFSGVFTPTEAAAIACLYAAFLGFVVYRTLHLADIGPILIETAETTGVVMVLVMAAGALGYCISVSRLPQEFGGALAHLTTNPLVYLVIVNALLIVVGCFMEALAAMLVLIPILVPVALKLGIDPVHFGLVFVLNLMIGTITPPVGVVLYVTAKVAQVPFDRISRAVLPYLVPLFAVLALCTLWPAVTTFLPGLLLGR